MMIENPRSLDAKDQFRDQYDMWIPQAGWVNLGSEWEATYREWYALSFFVGKYAAQFRATSTPVLVELCKHDMAPGFPLARIRFFDDRDAHEIWNAADRMKDWDDDFTREDFDAVVARSMTACFDAVDWSSNLPQRYRDRRHGGAAPSPFDVIDWTAFFDCDMDFYGHYEENPARCDWAVSATAPHWIALSSLLAWSTGSHRAALPFVMDAFVTDPHYGSTCALIIAHTATRSSRVWNRQVMMSLPIAATAGAVQKSDAITISEPWLTPLIQSLPLQHPGGTFANGLSATIGLR